MYSFLKQLFNRQTSSKPLPKEQNHFKKMVHFEHLVNLNAEAAKQSAENVDLWTSEYEQATKMACRRILAAYIAAKVIERKFPEEFEKAVAEASD